jgi:chromosome segregation ATPase
MPPELEQVLTDMAGGMQQISQTVEQQQATVEQLGSRQLEIENKLQELMQSLNGPAPFEGSTKSQQDVEAQAGAPTEGAPA